MEDDCEILNELFTMSPSLVNPPESPPTPPFQILIGHLSHVISGSSKAPILVRQIMWPHEEFQIDIEYSRTKPNLNGRWLWNTMSPSLVNPPKSNPTPPMGSRSQAAWAHCIALKMMLLPRRLQVNWQHGLASLALYTGSKSLGT